MRGKSRACNSAPAASNRLRWMVRGMNCEECENLGSIQYLARMTDAMTPSGLSLGPALNRAASTGPLPVTVVSF